MNNIGKPQTKQNSTEFPVHDLKQYRIVKGLRADGYDLLRDRDGRVALILRVKKR